MMSRFSSTSALCAAAVLASACAVYDSGLVQSNDGLSGGGSSGSNGGRGGSNATAGDSAVAGKNASGEAGTNAIGGTEADPSDGGEPSGEAGEAMGGTGGTTSGGGGSGGTEAGGNAGTTTGGSGGTAGAAGSGGTGGTAPVAQCSDHPISAKTTWVATASSESIGNGMESDGLYNPATHMTDASYAERWSSGKTQSGDEWIQIDFGVTVNLTGFTLNVNNDTGDFPNHYVVRMSNKSQDFAAATRASGDGMPGNTVITFPMASGRYLTVRQTGANTVTTAWWTIAEVFATCLDN